MNSKLIFSLTYALVIFNNLEIKNVKKTSNFINYQIVKMPDYFFFGVRVLSILFELIVFIVFFKRFHNLSNLKQLKIISIIKKYNIPFFSLYIRLFESNLLVKYYELNNE